MIDDTHDPLRRSWVSSAEDHPWFPIQNLPLGVFSPPTGTPPRGGIAIGDMIFDLGEAVVAGLFDGSEAEAVARTAAIAPLNAFLALGAPARRTFRRAVGELLDAEGAGRARVERLTVEVLWPISECQLHLPATIGGFTDFYAGIHHARNVGSLFRPDAPLLPNYKHIPVGYHGRASSVRPSGVAIRRPRGQIKEPSDEAPHLAASGRLDYELELGVWIGIGSELGEPIPVGAAAGHIGGFCLLNDWSARDIQAWEYQPLGPFLSKNFATTISPWIVMPEALAPFRTALAARQEGDPAPLPYLLDEEDQRHGALGLQVEVALLSARMREAAAAPQVLSRGSTRDLYWSFAQLVAHHTCGGCDLNPGDLLGTGTISGPHREGFGSLLEITEGGRRPVLLAGTGEGRRFLEDGDEVILRASAEREGFATIGFGECRAKVLPATAK